MKQFGTIFKFELNNYLKNKIFVGVTVFLVVAIAVVMFFPKFADSFTGGDSDSEGETEVSGMLLLSVKDAEFGSFIEPQFQEAFAGYEVCLTEDGLEDVKKKVTSGDAECAFVIDGPTSYTYYVNNLSLYDRNAEIADSVLRNAYSMNAMVSGGMSADEAAGVLAVEISHDTESLGKDQLQNFF